MIIESFDILGTACRVLSIAAGWAISLAAIVVLHGVDLRRGGQWSLSTIWVIVAIAGAWAGSLPLVEHAAPPVSSTVLLVLLAALVWIDVDALACHAGCVHKRSYGVIRLPQSRQWRDTEGADHA